MCTYEPDGVCAMWRESFPRARKPYRCSSCWTPIAVGEQHMAVFSIYEGNAHTERTCAVCTGLWRHFIDHHHGTGPTPRYLWDGLDECLDGIGDLSNVIFRGHRVHGLRSRHDVFLEREDVDVRNWRLFLAIIRRRHRAAKRAATKLSGGA